MALFRIIVRNLVVNKVHRCVLSSAAQHQQSYSTRENSFSQIEEEIRAKIKKSREKDMPIMSEKNPFEREKPKCILCQLDITPDYKNVKLLSQFISPYTGRIYGRHITGLCKAKQQQVDDEIRKARRAGFMAYMLKDVAFLKDPKLYNPDKPIRPHRF